ncbi:MAG: hypothetical protein KGJ23_16435 [Euryarchaeota archaeon]|nr:hypothetical protein [Euryarchaeota archaeon]MDE2045233.1 hypothetical protein [Thermoplasmata archaeon]
MHRRRGVTPIIATVLLLSLTMVLVGALYYFVRVPMPPQSPYVGFTVQWNDTQVELIGQGDNAPGASQCPSSTHYICYVRGMSIVVSEVASPAPVTSLIKVEFWCNNTIAAEAPLFGIEYSHAVANSPPGGPTPNPNGAQTCGKGASQPYIGPDGGVCAGSVTAGVGVPLYDLVYYTPTDNSTGIIEAGDTFTAYLGGDCLGPQDKSLNDDHYGPPAWCNKEANSCVVELWYTGNPSAFIGSFPLDPAPS